MTNKTFFVAKPILTIDIMAFLQIMSLGFVIKISCGTNRGSLCHFELENLGLNLKKKNVGLKVSNGYLILKSH